jgi:hypothetical protein
VKLVLNKASDRTIVGETINQGRDDRMTTEVARAEHRKDEAPRVLSGTAIAAVMIVVSAAPTVTIINHLAVSAAPTVTIINHLAASAARTATNSADRRTTTSSVSQVMATSAAVQIMETRDADQASIVSDHQAIVAVDLDATTVHVHLANSVMAAGGRGLTSVARHEDRVDHHVMLNAAAMVRRVNDLLEDVTLVDGRVMISDAVTRAYGAV